MELHVNDSQAIPEVAHFWQRVVDQILALPSKEGMVRDRQTDRQTDR